MFFIKLFFILITLLDVIKHFHPLIQVAVLLQMIQRPFHSQ